MTQTTKNCLTVKNSTCPATSAHETCTRFIAAIGELYPQLKSLHYRLRKDGERLTLRAKFGRRRIFVHGEKMQRTLARFARQCAEKTTNYQFINN